MNKEGLQYLANELAHAKVLKIGDRQYTDRKVHEVKAPTADTLHLTSLTGLVEYLKSDLDKLKEGQLVAQVVDPRTVEVFGPMFGDFRQRDMYVRADCSDVLPKTIFGSFMDQENFVIMLASSFVNDEALARLTVGGAPVGANFGVGDLEYCAELATGLVDKDTAKYEDDGLGQSVTVNRGVANLKIEKVKELVSLRPFRTFVDVMQPMSKFKLRIRPGGQLALFEADGGAWRLEAMRNIQAELEFRLSEAKVDNVLVIA